MMDCINIEYLAIDAQLNTSYKKLIGIFEEKNEEFYLEQKRRLVESEKRWIAFRDANCEFAGSVFIGGTAEPLIRMGCLVKTTAVRVKELNEFYNEFTEEN